VALLISILVGLVLGFLTRMVLKPRIEAGEARGRAIAADKNLEQEAALIQDPKFRNRLTELRRKLQVAAQEDGATPAMIDAAITNANTERNTAYGDLQQGLKKAEAVINSLGDVVTPTWVLPEEFQTLLDNAKTRYEAAKELLEGNDAADSAEAAETAAADLCSGLIKAHRAWSGPLPDLLGYLAGLKPLMATNSRESYDADVKRITDSLAKTVIEPGAGPESMKGALQYINHVNEGIAGLLRTAARNVETAYESMDNILRDIALPEKSLWSSATRSTKSFIEQLRTVEPNHVGIWKSPGQEGSRLKEVWRDALVQQMPEADERIAAAVDEGQFAAAARELEKALEVQPAGTSLGDGASTEETVTISADRSATKEFDSPLPTSKSVVVALKLPQPKPFAEFGQKSLRRLMRDKATQTFISGSVLTIVGYFIFAEKFVGTGGDFLTVFFWGFTTDIGVDALITAAKAKQP
jgi:hypothetical protein